MSRQYKDSGIEWIGQIPSDWTIVPTKRNFQYKKNIVGTKSDVYDRLALTMGGVIKRNKDDNEGLQPEKFDGYQILKPNELVFKLIDLANAKTSRVGLSKYTGIVSPAYIILRNKQKDNRFYYYWFMFMYYNLIFNHMGDDGVRSALSPEDVLNIPIPLISLKDQLPIADFLDKKCAEIDSLVELQVQMIAQLTEYKQSVITEAVTKGLKPEVKYVPSGIDWIGNIPEDWQISKVKWQLRERKEYSENGVEEPLSMSQKYGLIPTKEMDIIPNMASSFVGAKLVHEGDLVFNKLKAHLGVFAVSKYNGLVSPDYAVYYKRNNTSMKYLEYLFKTPQYIAEFRKLSTGVGAGLTRLYTNDLFSISCLLPPIKEQEAIAQYIQNKCTEIDNLIAIKQQKIETLNEYKKSIIFECVTGKKDIN